MLDAELRELREQISDSVDVPQFDTLVARGRRRRRSTVAGVAAVGLLVTGIAVGAGQVVQQRADTPPTSHTNDPTGVVSADDILDDRQAWLNGYESGTDGRAMSLWLRDCSEESCPTALAWTDDDWATRQSKLLPSNYQSFLVANGIVVYSDGGNPGVVLTDDGDEIDIKEPTGPQPVADDELVVYRIDDPQYVALDPTTGRTHELPSPPGVTTSIAQKIPTGELFSYGSRADDSMVYSSSTDGGRTWNTDAVPTKPGYATVFGTPTNAFVFQQGLDGPKVVVSQDKGATWHQVDKVPFGTVQCAQPLDDGRLLVTNGTHLYASTDASWRDFTEATDAPPLACLGGSDAVPHPPGLVTSITADWTHGLRSTDNGQTWTEVDPR